MPTRHQADRAPLPAAASARLRPALEGFERLDAPHVAGLCCQSLYRSGYRCQLAARRLLELPAGGRQRIVVAVRLDHANVVG